MFDALATRPVLAIDSLVSVVICTYRRAALVGRAIESVRHQSHRNIEIIIVDDASPDETTDIVRKISDNRIRYIRHKNNKGLPAARNTGIDLAHGEYVAFLDDDDEWRSDKIHTQLLAIKDHGAILSAALINGTRLKRHYSSVVLLSDLRKRNHFDPSSLMVRTEIIKKVRFDENIRQGEDWDAFIRIAQLCSIGYVTEPLLIYYEESQDSMTSAAKNMTNHELEIRMAMLHKHREFFGDFYYRCHIAGTYLSFLRYRQKKSRQLIYTIQRCGLLPVVVVFTRKLRRLMLRHIGLA